MSASSTKETVAGIPNLFASHEPAPATQIVPVASGKTVKVGQIVIIEGSSEVGAATSLVASSPVATSKLGVAATAGKAGEKISVYISGNFDKNALDYSVITPATTANAVTVAQLDKLARACGATASIVFSDTSLTPVTP